MRTAAGMPRAPPRKDRVAAIRSEPIAERPLHRARFAVRARAVIGTARIIEVVEQVHRIQLKRPVLVLEGGHGIDKRIAGRHDQETAEWIERPRRARIAHTGAKPNPHIVRDFDRLGSEGAPKQFWPTIPLLIRTLK